MLGLGLLGFALVAGSSARAADDGYQNVFSSVLGAVGLIKADPPPEIEYRERAPLVLPPNDDLPKPAATPQRSAAWPQDPDVIRRRKEGEAGRAPHGLDPSLSDKGVLLSKEELLRGRGQGEPVRPNECGNDGKQCEHLNPDVLRAEGERFKAANPEKSDVVVAGQAPVREYLTQPPTAYMRPTRTVKATTEAPEEKLDPSSPRYMQRQAAQRARENEE